MDNEIKIDGISEKSAIAIGDQTFRFSSISQSINRCFESDYLMRRFSSIFNMHLRENDFVVDVNSEEWIHEGLDCEILQPHSNDWQKGNLKMKVSISFEFTPESNESTQQQENITPESPLDEIRQMV
jgi:hypothetical protein